MIDPPVLDAQGVAVGVGDGSVDGLVRHRKRVGQLRGVTRHLGGDDLPPADDLRQRRIRHLGLDVIHQVHAVGRQIRLDVGFVDVLDEIGGHDGPLLGVGHEVVVIVAGRRGQIDTRGFRVGLHRRIEDVGLTADLGFGPDARDPVAAAYQ